ncbi:MAG: FAD:protein FMN transferase [Verrucomicrobiales bacterium]
MSSPNAPRLFRFNHEAMRTEWNFLLVSGDATQATGAAAAAGQEIDALEKELSRFQAYSDLGRLARLRAGESMSVGLAAWDCLSLAKDVWKATDGAFDAAIGALYELWKNRSAADAPTPAEVDETRARCGSDKFELIEDGLRVRVLVDRLKFDLGALGKGYALDLVADLLQTHWEMNDFLLITGGGSTILAGGCSLNGEPWYVNAGPSGTPSAPLHDRAVSASGFVHQGAHIIDPRRGLPVSTARRRAWAFAPTAALSDALSTAFLVMDPEEIARFHDLHPDTTSRLAEPAAPA